MYEVESKLTKFLVFGANFNENSIKIVPAAGVLRIHLIYK
jgi:hypothetical protein